MSRAPRPERVHSRRCRARWIGDLTYGIRPLGHRDLREDFPAHSVAFGRLSGHRPGARLAGCSRRVRAASSASSGPATAVHDFALPRGSLSWAGQSRSMKARPPRPRAVVRWLVSGRWLPASTSPGGPRTSRAFLIQTDRALKLPERSQPCSRPSNHRGTLEEAHCTAGPVSRAAGRRRLWQPPRVGKVACNNDYYETAPRPGAPASVQAHSRPR
jgi:hypothetical protein